MTPGTGTARWLGFALVTTLFWGVWGALIELPQKAGFPETLGYVVWAVTMVPCALAALVFSRQPLQRDARSVGLGLAVGLTGAGGQLLLFAALKRGPAFIVFPLVSLYPVIAILLSVWRLSERAPARHWWGIGLAVPAVLLLSYVPAGDDLVSGYAWMVLAALTTVGWGLQAFLMKQAQTRSGAQEMTAESLFFYMAASGLLLVPVALAMTDFSQPINWGPRGVLAAVAIHLLNAIGALTMVYAMRFGQAIIVAPMTALAPVITIGLSLAIYQRMPLGPHAAGMGCALVAMYLMAR